MPPLQYQNIPTKDPDLATGVSRAWKITSGSDNPDHEAGVATWLVHAPHGHPWWSWYVIGCVHLRDLPGQSQPPHVEFPGASHELLFVALNPEKPIPDVDDWKNMSHLTPIDLVHQFIVPDDATAAKLTELVVRHILDGNSPDQDHRGYWKRVIDRTAEHGRIGGHPDG